jgi:hypothetical protein
MSSPAISKKAFWDVSFENLDFEKSSLFINEKVFNYDDWNGQMENIKMHSNPLS